MKNCIQFLSENYKPIAWQSIFQKACVAVSENETGMAIINKNRRVLLHESILSRNEIMLCAHDQLFLSHQTALQKISCYFLNNTGLHLFSYQELMPDKNQSYVYINFLKIFCKELYSLCEIIFRYTYEHLSRRTYNGTKISHLDTVQSDFADITILFTKLSQLKLITQYDTHFFLQECTNILKILSRLAGARAVLKENTLELLFFVNFFIRFIA